MSVRLRSSAYARIKSVFPSTSVGRGPAGDHGRVVRLPLAELHSPHTVLLLADQHVLLPRAARLWREAVLLAARHEPQVPARVLFAEFSECLPPGGALVLPEVVEGVLTAIDDLRRRVVIGSRWVVAGGQKQNHCQADETHRYLSVGELW